jgi:DNA-binding transcriptional LysR family regulator
MIGLQDMHALVEVITNGGFARAARRLGVAKSIVSRRIARIEAELGTTLLNRTTRGITPTEAGLEFSERAQRILDDLAEARDIVSCQNGEVAGRLRVSLPLSFGLRHMTPLLTALHAAHPRLELDVSYDDSVVDLLAERFDAAIRIGKLPDSTLVARRVAPISLIVVASPAYLKKHRTPRVPQDLSAHECLVYTGSREKQAWRFQSGRRRLSFFPVGRFQSDNGEGLIQAAEAGLGVAALPDFIVSDSIKAGLLVPLLADYSLQEGAIYVVRPPGRIAAAKTRAFVDAVVEHFKRRRDEQADGGRREAQVIFLPATPPVCVPI